MMFFIIIFGPTQLLSKINICQICHMSLEKKLIITFLFIIDGKTKNNQTISLNYSYTLKRLLAIFEGSVKKSLGAKTVKNFDICI